VPPHLKALDVAELQLQMFGGANATFADPAAAEEFEGLDLVRASLYSLQSGQRFLFVGGQGIGKTSFKRALATCLDVEYVYIPAALVSSENLLVPFPVEDPELGTRVLEYLFSGQLHNDRPKWIDIDEIGRADPGMGNVLMELLQEGSLGGRRIENLLTVTASDNPQGLAYGRLNGLDFAQADRFATVLLSARDTPWPRALAARFPGVDLTDALAVWNRLSARTREVMSPRVLEHVIYALEGGFPGIAGLPMIHDEYVRLHDANGNDRTDKVLDDVAAALGVPNRRHVPDLLERAFTALVRDQINVYGVGDPGIGKTSKVKAMAAEAGVDPVYYSVPVLQPEDLAVPFPAEDGQRLDIMVFNKLMRPGRKVLILDEVFRASRRTANSLMEPIQERSIAGRPIPGLLGTFAINNPRQIAGYKLDVGKADLAQASRFTLSLRLQPTDTKFGEFLLQKYSDDAELMEVFLDWWKEDLDDLGRALITPRSLERLFGLYRAGLPLEWGKPFVAGEYVAVPLVDLQTRLERAPLARLRAVAAKVDEYEALLAEGEEAQPEAHLAVFTAFSRAELSQLEAQRHVCVRLMRVLCQQHKLVLIRPGGKRQKFWFDIVMETAPLDAAG